MKVRTDMANGNNNVGCNFDPKTSWARITGAVIAIGTIIVWLIITLDQVEKNQESIIKIDGKLDGVEHVAAETRTRFDAMIPAINKSLDEIKESQKETREELRSQRRMIIEAINK